MILAFRANELPASQSVGEKWWVSVCRLLFLAACLVLGTTQTTTAQTSVYGYGPYVNSVPLPVENGFVDAVNGNLHLEIPITTLPERGSVPFVAKFEYDSHIWQQVAPTGPISWQPTNIPNSNGGWRYVSPASGQTSHITDLGSCNDPLLGDLPYTEYYGFTWIAPDGRKIGFSGGTHRGNSCIGALSSFDRIASDGSGYHIYVTSYTATTVYAPDGTEVFPRVTDTNGNYYSADGSGNVIDTLGRTAVLVTTGTNQIFYDVLNSQNHTSRFTVNTTSISAKTAFGQSGVTECTTSCTITVVSSIGLPDGTSYSFKYDCDSATNSACGSASGHSSYYGVLTSMTLPTGAIITYAHTNFKDASNNQYLWVTSRVSGGTWSYTPQTYTTGCATSCQQYTVAQPSTDQELYQFTLYGSAMWNTNASLYSGSIGSGTLLESAQTDYTTTLPIQAIRVTTTMPSAGGVSLKKKTEITYDTSNLGNVMNQNQWQFYSGSFPTTQDRKTSYAYLTNSDNNMVNKQTTAQVFAGSSITATSTTTISYDSTAVGGSTGVVNHDDTNFPASYTARGNPTAVSYGFTAITLTYDLTGQVTQSQDAAGNVTTFNYTDHFFDDAAGGAVPHSTSTPTNAFVTSVTLPSPFSSWTNTRGYYWGTGKVANATDPNGAASSVDYLDSLDRITKSVRPMGWTMWSYPSGSETESDSYVGIQDSSPSLTCSSCRHDQVNFDSLGRLSTSVLVNDPEGADTVTASYDPTGRMQSVTNPERSTHSPTDGYDTYTYDGLGRVTKVTHPDGTYSSAYYGAGVTSAVGGITAQLCSSTTYGLGFPTLYVDEAGKKRQVWTDGFGRMIEADESNNSGTLSQNTCYAYDVLNNLTGVTQGTQNRYYTYAYQYNGTGVVGTAATPESGTVGYTYGCSGVLSGLCTRTDARNVKATYAYDHLNRLTGITYTGGTPATPAVTYTYDVGTNQKGFRTGMTDGSGSTTWTNNLVGWVVTESRTIAGKTNTISYLYNQDGSIKTITYPSGRTVAYDVRNAQRAFTATDSANNIQYAAAASYAPVGGLNSVIYGQVTGVFGGVTETRAYNNRLEFNSITASSAAGTAESLTFNYGTTANNGTLSSVANGVILGLGETFTYDPLNRIVTGATSSTSTTGCWGQSFGTTGNPPDDAKSNLTQINVTQCTGGLLSVTVDAATNRINSTGFVHDLSGNMTTEGGTAGYTYTYDAENHLTQASGMTGGPWTYAYDGDGLRVEKSNASGGTLYWRAITGDTIAETDLTGSTTNTAYREYIFFAGRRIASRDSATPTPNVYFYYTDHLGSTTAITTASGTVCYQASFTPYGEEHLAQTTTCPQNYKFTGYERDLETGLDYAFARYYDSRLGRFMSGDPLGGDASDPQSLNRYAYVENSPMNLTDPLGLKLPCSRDDPTHKIYGEGGCGAPAPFMWFMGFWTGSSTETGGWSWNLIAGGGVGVGSASCTLNVRVKNKAGLSDFQIVAIESQIAAIFSAAVNVNFSPSSGSYFSLNFTNAPVGETHMGTAYPGQPAAVYPDLYTSSIAAYGYSQSAIDTVTGTFGAHELVHKITGIGDIPFNPANPSDLMGIDDFSEKDFQGYFSALMSNTFQLSANEVKALQRACQHLTH
jgi:RHS repeat-associated protein